MSMSCLLESVDCKSNSDSNSTLNSVEHGDPLAVIHELTVYRKKSPHNGSRFNRKAGICFDNEFKQDERSEIQYPAVKKKRSLSVISPSIASSSNKKISAHHQLSKLRSIQSKQKKSISLSPKHSSNTINVRLKKQTPFTTKKKLNLKKRRIVPSTIGVQHVDGGNTEMCLDPQSVRLCQATIADYRCKFTKKRKITPSLIAECNYPAVTTTPMQVRAAPPKVEVKIAAMAKEQRRIIAPEVIGKCSKSSIEARRQLNTYFNAKNNQMFNEQDFVKYTEEQQNMSHFLGYAIIEEEHTAPMTTINEEKEKGHESDMSINSNPDGTNSYRRKMIKKRVPNCKHQLSSVGKMETKKRKTRRSTTPSKITDYFATVSSATNLNQ